MSHQIDHSTFRALRPEDIDWKPFPAFPPWARLAVVVGDPTEAGPYVIRVKLPPGSVIVLPGGTPHFHFARSGEYVTQVTAIGPLGLDYVDQSDVPRAA